MNKDDVDLRGVCALTSTSDSRTSVSSRPNNRPTSYTGASRTTQAYDHSDVAFLEWSTPNAGDKVYESDVDSMCSSILKQILVYPSERLPIQYNNFVLHALESYRKLKVEKERFKEALEAEHEGRQADLKDFQRTATFWSKEKAAFMVSFATLGSMANKGRQSLEMVMGLHSEDASSQPLLRYPLRVKAEDETRGGRASDGGHSLKSNKPGKLSDCTRAIGTN